MLDSINVVFLYAKRILLYQFKKHIALQFDTLDASFWILKAGTILTGFFLKF